MKVLMIWLFLGSIILTGSPVAYVLTAPATPSIKVDHSHPGMCKDGLMVAITDEYSIRPIATSDIQDLVIHADDTSAQEYLCIVSQWDYG
jgi:hypothetical protein